MASKRAFALNADEDCALMAFEDSDSIFLLMFFCMGSM